MEILGQLVAHYKILHKIASGGMGDVYLAEDITLDRQLRLKSCPRSWPATQSVELGSREKRRPSLH